MALWCEKGPLVLCLGGAQAWGQSLACPIPDRINQA